MPAWRRLPMHAVLTVVRLDRPDPDGLEHRLQAAAVRLDRHYAVVDPRYRTTWWAHGGDIGVLVTSVDPAPAGPVPSEGDAGPRLAWGVAVGAEGQASDDELESLHCAPRPTRHLLGRFVLAGPGPAGLRLVTSADLVHTLKRVVAPGVSAWSTRGWAALIAADRPVQVAAERIAEFVVFENVLNGDELLAGVRTLPVAWQVDLSPCRANETSWWPVDERLRPGPPASGAQLWEALVDEMGRVACVPGLHLGLTAGRDSTLVALALAAAGRPLPTYTFGVDGSADVVVARSTARALGLPHLLWQPSGSDPRPSLERARTLTAWTEGLQTAADIVFPPMRWDGPPDLVYLAGIGGETGRALYYGDCRVPGTVDGIAAMLAGALPLLLPPAVASAVGERLHLAVAEAAGIAGEVGPRTFDVLYATMRMHTWVDRGRLAGPARAAVTAYTSPGLTRLLLDLPEAARRDGSGFDAAGGERAALLRAAAPRLPAPGVGDRVHRLVQSRVGQVRGAYRLAKLTRRWAGGAHDHVASLDEVHRHVGGVVRAALGERWWAATWAEAPYAVVARRRLWNALAVEVLAEEVGVG